MHRLILAVALFVSLIAPATAADFPGPKVKDAPPFNKSGVMTATSMSCPGTYTSAQFATERRKITADIAACVKRGFGISKDLGLDFGVSAPYSDCVIPDSYDARPPANNPMWPVCCPIEDGDNVRFACRLYFASH